MTSSFDQARIVDAFREVWSSLSELLGTLDDDDWQKASPLPGWSVQDNVAHIIGTEEMLRGADAPAIEIDRESSPHVRSDIAVFNEVWVESLRQASPSEMLTKFRDTTGARLEALDQMSHDDWDAETMTPIGKSTYGRFMQIRAFDCWLHEQDIRDAVGRPGHEQGVAVDVTLDEMETAMGFVVGKKAGAQPGDRVTFALTANGSVVREVHVEVGERAKVVTELSGPATVTLTMPVGVMTRRCAGRVGPEDMLTQVQLDGNLALAARILQNQSYTI